METFSVLLAIGAGNHQSPVNSSHKGQWRGALVCSLICVWINGCVNNREAGYVRRYGAHYDITVMTLRDFAMSSGKIANLTKYIYFNITLFYIIPRSRILIFTICLDSGLASIGNTSYENQRLRNIIIRHISKEIKYKRDDPSH